jgi:hypothetical protein
VNAVEPGVRQGGSPLTFAVATFAVVLFGLVGGLPDLAGPAVGVVGLVTSALVRRRTAVGATYGPLPALVALLVIATTAPAVGSAMLFGGLAALAVLLWLADDPARPAGGGRRATLPLATCGLAIAIAWSLVLVLPRPSREVGVAGGLLAALLLLLAYLLVRSARQPHEEAASA